MHTFPSIIYFYISFRQKFARDVISEISRFPSALSSTWKSVRRPIVVLDVLYRDYVCRDYPSTKTAVLTPDRQTHFAFSSLIAAFIST